MPTSFRLTVRDLRERWQESRLSIAEGACCSQVVGSPQIERAFYREITARCLAAR